MSAQESQERIYVKQRNNNNLARIDGLRADQGVVRATECTRRCRTRFKEKLRQKTTDKRERRRQRGQKCDVGRSRG